MDNTIARLFDTLASPETVAALWVMIGVLLLFTRHWRKGRAGLAALASMLLILLVFPIDLYLAQLLENRFPPHPPDRVDGIVVLGGAISMALSLDHHQTSLNSAADRMTEMVALMHQYPDVPIVFTGGAANPFDQSHKEADLARDLLVHMGIDPSRVIFERDSRNTHENALYSKDLVRPQPGQNWVLVTSALHMTRSMGAFQAVEWKMLPWPVDFQTSREGGLGLTPFSPRRMQVLNNLLHETIGLLYYHLRGWSPLWLPAP